MSSAAFTKTASRCATEAASGQRVFKIVGYSLEKGVGVGEFVRSRTFSVGGYDWAIRFYPDGLNESYKDYISICLELMSKNAETRACYDLGLVHQTNKVSGFECISPTLFKSSDNTLRFGSQDPRFMLRTELEEGYVCDDCVTIDCSVVVVNFEIEVPPCDIREHFAELLDQKVGADVTFNVRGEIFEAHTVILAARSPVFKAQFFGQMSEKKVGHHVTIEDMEPDIFKALMHFVYSGSMHDMGDDLDGDDYNDMIWHLLAAADRYAVDRLKLMCQSILSKNLSMENVATTLAFADQHHCNKLKEVCIEFITMSDMNALVATQGYANLKRACPSVLAEIEEKTSKRCKN